MDITIHYVVPTLLCLGALWLALQEYVGFRRCSGKPWIRFLRRISGAVLLIVIAYMMHKGDTTLIFMESDKAAEYAKQNREYANGCLNYWMTVMVMVMATVAMAIWDVIDSLIRIRSMLSESAREDMQAFKEVLEKSQANKKLAQKARKGENNAQ
ncbi:hypothetical protein IJT17_09340 [bacterium]|nr:hypothetical protein [bacterium]